MVPIVGYLLMWLFRLRGSSAVANGWWSFFCYLFWLWVHHPAVSTHSADWPCQFWLSLGPDFMLEETIPAETLAIFLPPPHLKTGGCQNLWLYDRQSLHPTSFSSPPLVSFLWGFPLCLKFSCLQPCSAQPASKQFMAQKLLIRTALPVDVEPGWSPTLIFLEEFSAWILSWIVGFESWDMSSELALLDSLHTRWAGEKLAFFLCKISQGEQGAGGSSDLGSVFHYAPYWLCEHGQIHFNIFAITFFFSKILKRALIGGG